MPCCGHMLHHWSDVAISTIDAFTRRVVQPFARDLRLDHDLRMTTEQDHYLNAAVDGLIEASGHRPAHHGHPYRSLPATAARRAEMGPRLARCGPWRHELQKESAIGPLCAALGAMDDLVSRRLSDRLRAEEQAFREFAERWAGRHCNTSRPPTSHREHWPTGAEGISATSASWPRSRMPGRPPGSQARKPLESGTWHSG